jgi:hypothetical protein
MSSFSAGGQGAQDVMSRQAIGVGSLCPEQIAFPSRERRVQAVKVTRAWQVESFQRRLKSRLCFEAVAGQKVNVLPGTAVGGANRVVKSWREVCSRYPGKPSIGSILLS